MTTKRKRYSEFPGIHEYPPLVEWLNKVNGHCLWQRMPPTEGAATVEAWAVNGHVVIIVVYADKHGWSIYTEPQTNSIAETLADVELRCGIKPSVSSGSVA